MNDRLTEDQRRIAELEGQVDLLNLAVNILVANHPRADDLRAILKISAEYGRGESNDPMTLAREHGTGIAVDLLHLAWKSTPAIRDAIERGALSTEDRGD